MPIYKFNNSDNVTLKKAKGIELANISVQEKVIQNIFQKDISILSEVLYDGEKEKLKVIKSEFKNFYEANRRIDMLCLDKENNLVVVELKRHDPGHMELQALRYAAFMSNFTFKNICDTFEENGGKRGELLAFLGAINEDNAVESFNKNMKIVLVAEVFTKEITSTVLWLNSFGIDISCVRMNFYEDSKNDYIADIEKIIPIKEAEEYMIGFRQKESTEKEAAKSNRDLSKYTINGGQTSYCKGRLVLKVVSDWVKKQKNKPTFKELERTFPTVTQGSFGVFAREDDEKVLNHSIRYFCNDPIKLRDCQIVVCSQWGIGNIGGFIAKAKDLGFKIEKIS